MSAAGVSAGRISLAPDPPTVGGILLWLRRGVRMIGRWWATPKLRELRLCETLALGDHRFVALVRCGRQRFLIGGAGNSLALLAELPSPKAEAPTNKANELENAS